MNDSKAFNKRNNVLREIQLKLRPFYDKDLFKGQHLLAKTYLEFFDQKYKKNSVMFAFPNSVDMEFLNEFDNKFVTINNLISTAENPFYYELLFQPNLQNHIIAYVGLGLGLEGPDSARARVTIRIFSYDSCDWFYDELYPILEEFKQEEDNLSKGMGGLLGG